MKQNRLFLARFFPEVHQTLLWRILAALLLAFSLSGTLLPGGQVAAQSGLSLTTLAQFANGAYPAGLAYGPLGRYWLTLTGSNAAGWATPDGTTASTSLSTPAARPLDITIGPDGALWFTEQAADKIARIDPAHPEQLNEYPVTGPDSGGQAKGPAQIVLGQDGALWFTEYSAGRIARMTLDGKVSEYALSDANSKPLSIISAPDGTLWFSEWGRRAIGRIGLDGQIREYSISGATSAPSEIVYGPDGNLWFIFEIGRRLMRMNPATGAMTSFNLATQNNALTDLAVGPDGRLWYIGVQAVGSVAVTDAGPGDLVEALLKPAFEGQGRSQIAAGPGAEMVFTNLSSSEVSQVALAEAKLRNVQLFAPKLLPWVFAEGAFDMQLEVVNWSSSPVTNVQVTLTLDENITLVEAAPFVGACQAAGQQVVCTVASLAGNATLPLNFTLRAGRINATEVDRQLSAAVSSTEGDFLSANNRLVHPVKILNSFDYSTGFDRGADGYWSHNITTGSNPRLGMFSNDNVTLTFPDLPPHNKAQMCFDLYITGGWDGDQLVNPDLFGSQPAFIGPDIWAHYLNETRLQVVTFSNQAGYSQSYPDDYEEIKKPAHSGAAETGDFDGDGIANDARYFICWDRPHSAETFKATFYGVNLDGESGEHWSLDNVQLKISNNAAFSYVYLPLVISGK